MEASTEFHAYDADGNEYKLIAKRDDHGSEVIQTADGDDVRHIARGVYVAFLRGKSIRIISDDEFAP